MPLEYQSKGMHRALDCEITATGRNTHRRAFWRDFQPHNKQQPNLKLNLPRIKSCMPWLCVYLLVTIQKVFTRPQLVRLVRWWDIRADGVLVQKWAKSTNMAAGEEFSAMPKFDEPQLRRALVYSKVNAPLRFRHVKLGHGWEIHVDQDFTKNGLLWPFSTKHAQNQIWQAVTSGISSS